MNWITLLGFFGGPLGGIINKGITAGAGAILGWSAAKGNPFGDITPVVSALALAVSTVITGFAATQGIQIPRINADLTNGVRVVKADSASPSVSGPL